MGIKERHDARCAPPQKILTWRSTMKVYLASPYSQKNQMNTYAAELRAGGVEVTSSWLEETHAPNVQMHELTHEEHLQYAYRDIKDVQAAKIFVFFTDPTKTLVRGGRHVEFGIAVERGMPIYVVGEERENIFHHLPKVIHFKRWENVRDLLIHLAAL
jgi:nucleoside 2-deoxyribosyltransferase